METKRKWRVWVDDGLERWDCIVEAEDQYDAVLYVLRNSDLDPRQIEGAEELHDDLGTVRVYYCPVCEYAGTPECDDCERDCFYIYAEEWE